MRKGTAHKRYYDKSYFYDSIHTGGINITLPMQKQYMTPRAACHLDQEDFHYPHPAPTPPAPQKKKKTRNKKRAVFKTGDFIHIFLRSLKRIEATEMEA